MEYQQAVLSQHGLYCSRTRISGIFKKWGWSFRKPDHKQLNKYSAKNIQYYYRFVTALQNIDPKKLKYADECHFVSRELHRDLILGPKGKKVRQVVAGKLNFSYSMTIVTDLSDESPQHISACLRKATNTQWDFAEFVVSLAKRQILRQGDYFLIDNATVHKGSASFPMIQQVLEAAGVTLIYLPKYSPELNPCELVFAQTKRRLRNLRGNQIFWWEVRKALSHVTKENLTNYYSHCIFLRGQDTTVKL